MLKGLTTAALAAAVLASGTFAVNAQEYTIRATANSNENDEDYDGLVWYRRNVTIPADWAGCSSP